jgi:hypothetical protein
MGAAGAKVNPADLRGGGAHDAARRRTSLIISFGTGGTLLHGRCIAKGESDQRPENSLP